MKSRMSHSGMGRRLLVVNSALLLLANCFILAQSDPVTPNVHNWFEVSAGSWPVLTNVADKKPFYVYHAESVEGTIFSLKKDLLTGVQVVADPDLELDYWTDSDSGVLRSRPVPNLKPVTDVKLSEVDKWAKSKVTAKVDVLRNLGFLNQFDFTIAFRDVVVKYIETINDETKGRSPVTGYKGKDDSDNVEKFEFSGLPGAPQATSVGEFVEITLAAPVESLTFQYKIYPVDPKNDKALAAKIELEGTACKIKDAANIKIEVQATCTGTIIKTLKFNSKQDQEAVAIWELKNGKDNTAITGAKFKPASTAITGSYRVKENKADNTVSYVSVINSHELDKDNCYNVQKSAGNKEVEVYLTFENANNGIKLTTIKGSSKFCLNDFVALKNLNNYQLTLVVRGKVEKAFVFQLDKYTDTRSFATENPKDTIEPDLVPWLNYNPLFDYTIKAVNIEKTVDTNFIACDIVANCFPYVKEVTPVDATKQTLTYTLREEYKNILASSPFVRIAPTNEILKPEDLAKFKLTNKASENGANLLKKKLIEQNANLNDKSVGVAAAVVSFNANFDVTNDDKTKLTTIKLPLDTLDYRAQKLAIKITLDRKAGDTTSELSLSQLIYKSSADDVDFTFPDESLPKFDIKFVEQTISTDQVFVMPNTQAAVKGRSATFQLKLKPNKDGDYPVVKVSLTVSDLVTPIVPISEKLTEVKDKHLQYIPASLKGKSIPSGQNLFILTEWIKAGENQNLEQTKFNVELEITSAAEIDLTKIQVYRVVFGQGNPESIVPVANVAYKKDGSKKDIKTDLLVTDAIASLDSNTKGYALKGAYKIGYFIHTKEKDPITVAVNKFVLESPVEQDKDSHCKEPSIINDCSYEASKCPVEYDKCQTLKTLYRSGELTCDKSIGCSNIFDTPFLVSSVYAQGAVPKYVPYQIKATDTVASAHNLEVKRPDTKKEEDFCITFDYLAKDSPLLVSANVSTDNYFSVEYPQNYLEPATGAAPVAKNGKICASWLSNDVTSVQEIHFRFPKPSILDVTNNYIIFKSQDFTTKPNVIKEGIYLGDSNTLKDNIIGVTAAEWATSEKNTLTFFADLEQLKKNNGDTYVSYLRTKWFNVPTTEQIKLSLKVNEATKADFYHLTVDVNSPEQNLLSKSISEISGEKMNTFKVPDTVKHYQVTLKLTLDLSKKVFSPTDKKDFALSLEAFTINDACVDDKNAYITCTDNHGTCNRIYTNLTRHCACKSGYEGDDCEETDYCKIDNGIGERYCKSVANNLVTCTSNRLFESFECKCKDGLKWDFLSASCIPKEFNCADNQEVGYDSVTRSVGCVCKEGKKDKDKDGKEICVPEDPCKNSGCPKNSKCAPSADKRSYTCNCDAGFVNKLGVKSRSVECVHEKCLLESPCAQSCVQKNEAFECKCNTQDYDQDGEKCKAKTPEIEKKCQSSGSPAPFVRSGACHCVDGYWWNATGTACQLDTASTSFFAKNLGCTKGVELRDGKPACECDKVTEVYDSESRSCKAKTVCSEQEAANCLSQHNAQCGLDLVNKKPVCKCSDSEVKFVEFADPEKTKDEDRKWKCVNRCSILQLPDREDYSCNGAFQQCNAANVKVDISKTHDIFVGNHSSDSAITSLNNPTGHCDCLTGFEQPSGDLKKCVQNIYHEVAISMEFTTDSSENFLQLLFVNLLNSLVKPVNSGKYQPKCTKQNGTSTVQCTASFAAKKNQTQIETLLHDACVPTDKTNAKCVYLVKYTPGSGGAASFSNVNDESFELVSQQQLVGGGASEQISSRLVRDTKKDFQVALVDICKKEDPCRTFANSLCSKVEDNSHLIKCTCDPSYFSVVSSNTFGSKNAKFEACKVRDLCTEDTKNYGCQSDAQCHFKVEYSESKNQYAAKSFCSCEATKTTLPSRELSCKQTCDGKGQCSANADKCAINMYDPSKFVCHCKDSYTGEFCDKKVESESTSKAYLISTIVVSIIAVIALIGLAVLYFRRR